MCFCLLLPSSVFVSVVVCRCRVLNERIAVVATLSARSGLAAFRCLSLSRPTDVPPSTLSPSVNQPDAAIELQNLVDLSNIYKKMSDVLSECTTTAASE